MQKKLTEIPSVELLDNNDLMHVVDVSDTTDDPAGSSRKTPLSNLKEFFTEEVNEELSDIVTEIADLQTAQVSQGEQIGFLTGQVFDLENDTLAHFETVDGTLANHESRITALESEFAPRAPNVIIRSAGSFGIYTPTAGVKYVIFELLGGGGDGSGSGQGNTGSSGFSAGTSSLVSGGGVNLQCGTGGKGVTSPTPSVGAPGVSVSLGLPVGAFLIADIPGNPGSPPQACPTVVGGVTMPLYGGNGGASVWGGGGQGGAPGFSGSQASAPGTGGGGGGLAVANQNTDRAGYGGGSGSYIKALIPAAVLSSFYTFSVGSDNAVAGGLAGTNGKNGGGARGGRIVITEYF